jgi:hypothetical protein
MPPLYSMSNIKFKPLTNKYQRIPHIITFFEYNNNGKEGYIVFDGFYYVNNTTLIDESLSHCRFQESLPQTLEMYVDEKCFRVECYRRDILECTDDLANILEPDFQPTDKQKLYFRVLG